MCAYIYITLTRVREWRGIIFIIIIAIIIVIITIVIVITNSVVRLIKRY